MLSSVLDQQPQDYPSVQQAVHDLGVTALPAASAADPDIEELPSNVEVFVRRVLKAVVYDRVLPIVQQMWQAVWPRFADYLPDTLRLYAQDPSLRTLGTLPTALSALSDRKISNGGATNDGIKDGTSLAHILGDSSVQVTKIVDDNTGWTMDKVPYWALFPNATDWSFGCTDIDVSVLTNNQTIETLRFPALEIYKSTADGQPAYNINSLAYTSAVSYLEFPKLREVWELCTAGGEPFGNLPNLEVLSLPNLEFLYMGHGGGLIRFSNGNCSLREVLLPKLQEVQHTTDNGAIIKNRDGAPDNIVTKRLVVGTLKAGTNIDLADSLFKGLEDIEVGAGTCVSFKISAQCTYAIENNMTTFLQNFLHHIAERLAVGPTTNRLTLTLSADVYSACGFGATIDDQTDIRYQIKKAIQDRNWKVTDGTNNFNQ